MPGKRHPAWRRGPLLFAPLSVLVLLASVCFPTLAQADSSGIEYSDAPPTVTGNQKIPSRSGSSPNSSKTGGVQSADGDDGVDSSEAGVGAANDNPSSGAGKKGKAGSDRGTGQRSRGDGSAGKPQAGLQENGQPVAAAEDDGSSPLLPILIAVAALAAISIGAVLMRQRRSRDDSGVPVSPKAS